MKNFFYKHNYGVTIDIVLCEFSLIKITIRESWKEENHG